MPEDSSKKRTEKKQDVKAPTLPVSKAVLLWLYFYGTMINKKLILRLSKVPAILLAE